MDKQWTKMSGLVNKDITVVATKGYKFKMYDNGEWRESDTWQQGYTKKYRLELSDAMLEVSAAQLGQMLEGVFKDGVSDIRGTTFHVKSNGKEGKEIRYYINPVRQNDSVRQNDTKPVENTPTDDDAPIDLSSIPF